MDSTLSTVLLCGFGHGFAIGFTITGGFATSTVEPVRPGADRGEIGAGITLDLSL